MRGDVGPDDVLGGDPVVDPIGRLCFSVLEPKHAGDLVFVRLEVLDGRHLLMTVIGKSKTQVLTRFGGDSAAAADAREKMRASRLLGQETSGALSGLKTAELSYDAAFDTFVATEVWPRPLDQLNGTAAQWQAGSKFDTLGWRPEESPRASYQASLDVAHGFRVDAWLDLDDDGVLAHWTVTRDSKPERLTPPEVQ